MRLVLPAAAVVFVFSFATEAIALQQGESLRARVRRWQADISGDIEVDDLGVSGTSVDLESLDYDKAGLNDIGVIAPIPGLGRMFIQYWWGEFEGAATLGNDIVFAGNTYTAGSPLGTKFEWKAWSLLYEYPLSGAGLGLGMGSQLYGQGGFKYIRSKVEIDSGGVGASAEFKGLSPAIGFRGTMALMQWLYVEAEVNGFFARSFTGGVSGTLLDGTVGVFGKFSFAYGGVGMRWFQLKANDSRSDVEDFDTDLEIKGMFFEVGVKF
jgi:hypothetical protein